MANTLASCVSSLRSTNTLLSSSISILDSGVNDFPRLEKVLQTTRVCPTLPPGSAISVKTEPKLMSTPLSLTQHFELLPESHLQTAQSRLLSTLTPELNTLLDRISAHIDKLSRREQALIARSELLEGRIGEERRASNASGGRGSASMEKESHMRMKCDGKEVIKLKALRAKKERLGYAVERLTLQAQQRERQLRMSIAAT
ncbi:MAG: hypothetical protein Q9217_005436 [Psora testacea]